MVKTFRVTHCFCLVQYSTTLISTTGQQAGADDVNENSVLGSAIAETLITVCKVSRHGVMALPCKQLAEALKLLSVA